MDVRFVRFYNERLQCSVVRVGGTSKVVTLDGIRFLIQPSAVDYVFELSTDCPGISVRPNRYCAPQSLNNRTYLINTANSCMVYYTRPTWSATDSSNSSDDSQAISDEHSTSTELTEASSFACFKGHGTFQVGNGTILNGCVELHGLELKLSDGTHCHSFCLLRSELHTQDTPGHTWLSIKGAFIDVLLRPEKQKEFEDAYAEAKRVFNAVDERVNAQCSISNQQRKYNALAKLASSKGVAPNKMYAVDTNKQSFREVTLPKKLSDKNDPLTKDEVLFYAGKPASLTFHAFGGSSDIKTVAYGYYDSHPEYKGIVACTLSNCTPVVPPNLWVITDEELHYYHKTEDGQVQRYMDSSPHQAIQGASDEQCEAVLEAYLRQNQANMLEHGRTWRQFWTRDSQHMTRMMSVLDPGSSSLQLWKSS
eukprot:TRINITY_DN60319_c0_g1_i2.p1 TRINITY_DN60319_c0_g1~~TRINITY_DN60319_c0_g1_i2.p1  ORF type:complete len:422 (+),score=33.42 TRINITY_DN60319_c0_g1_i2:25-1290(+)